LHLQNYLYKLELHEEHEVVLNKQSEVRQQHGAADSRYAGEP
jgi:hypothetical protein